MPLSSLPPRGRWHGKAVTEGDCDLYRFFTLHQSASQTASLPFVGFADISPTGNYSQREPLNALSNRHINRNLLLSVMPLPGMSRTPFPTLLICAGYGIAVNSIDICRADYERRLCAKQKFIITTLFIFPNSKHRIYTLKFT